MKSVLVACAVAFAIPSAFAAAGPTFELRLDERDGERVVAVIDLATGAGVVAAGGETLDLLAGKEADKTLASLRGEPDLDLHAGEGRAGVTVHKMDYDEDPSLEARRGEKRIIDRRRADAIGFGASSKDDLGLEEDSVRRIIYIRGAGAAEAVKFIDDIVGLEFDERRAMKETVGL